MSPRSVGATFMRGLAEGSTVTDRVTIPGDRELNASLDRSHANRVVVGCPPHPRMGGSRSDARLRAVSDTLGPDFACLRFDYGPWTGGDGEYDDVVRAVKWAASRYESIGVFGYSFGASLALLAAAKTSPAAVSALAPADHIGQDLDVIPALTEISCPGQIVYGERDTTVDSTGVAERAGSRGFEEVRLSADHFYVGQMATVAEHVGGFLREHL